METVPREILDAQARLEARRAELGLPPKTSPPTSSAPGLVAALFPPSSNSGRLLAGEGVDCPICGRCYTASVFEQHKIRCEERQRQEQRMREEAEAREAARREAVSNGELSHCVPGISLDHGSAQLRDFPVSVHESIRRGMKSESFRGFLLGGPAGTGKTRLMAAICREYLIPGNRVYWTMARELLRRIWSTYRDKAAETEEVVIEELQGVAVLAIDDLGHEGKVSDAAIGAFHEIIAVRHDNHRPTLITTNLGIQDIEKVYDASIASRIGSWCPVMLVGKDRR